MNHEMSFHFVSLLYCIIAVIAPVRILFGEDWEHEEGETHEVAPALWHCHFLSKEAHHARYCTINTESYIIRNLHL